MVKCYKCNHELKHTEGKKKFAVQINNINKQEQIKLCWKRINKIEEKIQELSKKGLNYFSEIQQRRALLDKIKLLEHKR